MACRGVDERGMTRLSRASLRESRQPVSQRRTHLLWVQLAAHELGKVFVVRGEREVWVPLYLSLDQLACTLREVQCPLLTFDVKEDDALRPVTAGSVRGTTTWTDPRLGPGQGTHMARPLHSSFQDTCGVYMHTGLLHWLIPVSSAGYRSDIPHSAFSSRIVRQLTAELVGPYGRSCLGLSCPACRREPYNTA